jgi:hypothetical protein
MRLWSLFLLLSASAGFVACGDDSSTPPAGQLGAGGLDGGSDAQTKGGQARAWGSQPRELPVPGALERTSGRRCVQVHRLQDLVTCPKRNPNRIGADSLRSILEGEMQVSPIVEARFRDLEAIAKVVPIALPPRPNSTARYRSKHHRS